MSESPTQPTPPVRRLAAATCVLVLVALVSGCAPQKVAERPPRPQAEQETLLPPPEAAKKDERPTPVTKMARPPELAAPGAPDEAPGEARGVPPAAEPPADGEAAPEISLVPPPGVREAVRVGLLVPLSGRDAEVGAAMLNAAQMALFDMGDRTFMLMPRDTGGSPDEAARAAREVIDAGARIILGPLRSESVQAVAAAARPAGVPVVGFSTDRTVAGDGVFLMGLLPQEQVRRVISFARGEGHLRFAVLAPDTPFGATVVRAAQQAVEANGAVLTQVELYPPGGDATAEVRRLADYATRRAALQAQVRELESRDDEVSRQALARLKRLETLGDVAFDAILIPEGGEQLRQVAPLLPYYDIDPDKVQFLGTAQWDDPSLGTEPALVGGWFAAPPPAAREDFVARFKALYGHGPRRLATIAYDAAALAAVLAQAEGGPDFSTQALTAEHGFAGVDGIFRFRPEGIAERGLAVLEMHRNELEVVGPAPEVFTKYIF